MATALTAFGLGDSIGLAANDTLVRAYERTASGSLPLFVCDGADQIGNPAALVDGFQAAFLGAGAIALAGAGLTAAWLRSPRPSPAPVRVQEGSFAD